MAFDPATHFRVLTRKDKKTGEIIESNYLDCKWRIQWFREVHPNGRIFTTEIYVGPIWTIKTEWKNRERTTTEMEVPGARFKAEVFDADGNSLATGYKSETLNDFPDFYEKSETGAIGRALALAGFGTQFAEDFEEADRDDPEHIALADSPVEVKVKEFQPNTNPNLSVVSSTPPAQDSLPTHCEECGTPIESFKVGTRNVTAVELAAKSKKDHGKALCRGCYNAKRGPAK